MRIFLSYPSELHDPAARVRLALAADGHQVFFDHSSLPASKDFDTAIRRAVEKSDLFIYLVTPESVAEGAYTRTELKFSEVKWPHPKGRLLPVMAQPTDIESVPPYARAVTILKPEGDIAAEVAAAVAAIAKDHAKRKWAPLAAVAVLGTVTGLGFWFFHSSEPLQVEVSSVAAWARGFGTDPDQFLVSGATWNRRENTEFLSGIRGEINQGAIDVELSLQYDDDATQLEQSPGREAAWAAVASFRLAETGRGLQAEAIGKVDWRVCLDFVDREICSRWQPWGVDSPFSHPPPIDLSADVGERARRAASSQKHFLLTTSNPSQLWALSLTGDVETTIDLQGEPVGLAANEERIVVATEAPDIIVVLDATNHQVVNNTPIPQLSFSYGGDIQAASTRPASLAIAGDTLWLVTAGGSGEAGLMYSTDWGSTWAIPAYYDGFELDARDLRLRARRGDVWGVPTNTTPSSLYAIAQDGFTEFSGHENEDVSCATDVAPLGEGNVLIRDCKFQLIELKQSAERLTKTRTLGPMQLQREGRYAGDVWTSEILAHADLVTMAAIELTSISDGSAIHAGIVSLGADNVGEAIFEAPELKMVDIAITQGHALVIVSDSEDRAIPLLYRY